VQLCYLFYSYCYICLLLVPVYQTKNLMDIVLLNIRGAWLFLGFLGQLLHDRRLHSVWRRPSWPAGSRPTQGASAPTGSVLPDGRSLDPPRRDQSSRSTISVWPISVAALQGVLLRAPRSVLKYFTRYVFTSTHSCCLLECCVRREGAREKKNKTYGSSSLVV